MFLLRTVKSASCEGIAVVSEDEEACECKPIALFRFEGFVPLAPLAPPVPRKLLKSFGIRGTGGTSISLLSPNSSLWDWMEDISELALLRLDLKEEKEVESRLVEGLPLELELIDVVLIAGVDFLRLLRLRL